ncbi:Ionotropic receptor 868 [Blattella germanica]|nr:Ionotropic receptor 868 [Blattella germanica]
MTEKSMFKIITALLFLLFSTLGEELKININEDVLAECILHASIRFFHPEQAIAVIPQLQYINDDNTNMMPRVSEFSLTGKQCLGKFKQKTIYHYKPIDELNNYKIGLSRIVFYWKHVHELTLRKLHSSGQWPVFAVSNSTYSTLFAYKSLIVFFSAEVSGLDLFRLFDSPSRIMVVVTVDKNCLKCRSQAMAFLKNIAGLLQDSLILLWEQESTNVSLQTFLPYQEPYGVCGYVHKVIYLDTWINDGNGGAFLENANLTLIKIPETLICCKIVPLDLIDSILNVLDFRLLDYANKIMTNSTKCKFVDSRYVATSMASKLLFIDPRRHYPYKTLVYSYFVPRAKYHSRWSWFISVFETNLLMLCTVALVIMSFLIKFFSSFKSINDAPSYGNLSHCSMLLWSSLLGVGVNTLPRSIKIRILFFSWIVYSLCVSTVFQTAVTSYFIAQSGEHQIDTIEELELEGFETVHNVDSNPSFSTTNYMETLLPSDSFKYAINTPKTALHTTKELFKFHSKELCEEEEMPSYHKFSQYEDTIFIGMEIRNDPLLQSRLNQILERLATSGIVEKVWKDIVWNAFSSPQKSLILRYESLNLIYLQSAFYFLLFGLISSVVSFLLELFFHINVLMKFRSFCQEFVLSTVIEVLRF